MAGRDRRILETIGLVRLVLTIEDDANMHRRAMRIISHHQPDTVANTMPQPSGIPRFVAIVSIDYRLGSGYLENRHCQGNLTSRVFRSLMDFNSSS